MHVYVQSRHRPGEIYSKEGSYDLPVLIDDETKKEYWVHNIKKMNDREISTSMLKVSLFYLFRCFGYGVWRILENTF